MPAEYTKKRDECYERKRKKGKLTEQGKKDCKKMASIWYYRTYGKPVKHADASIFGEDPETEIQILIEQLDAFGSFEEYENWNRSDFGKQ